MIHTIIRRPVFVLAVLTGFIFSGEMVSAQDAGVWNKKTADEWFNKKEWQNSTDKPQKGRKYDAFGQEIIDLSADSSGGNKAAGRQITAQESIDKVEFAKQYHANRRWWDEAFSFLRDSDIAAIKPGKYPIDGDNVVATVFEGTPKMSDTTKWESHRNFEDIHYVFSGEEQIEVAPVATAKVVKAYDPARDITNYETKGKYYLLAPGTFFIVFTQSAHRPGLKVPGHDSVKHVVIKVRDAK
jgi:YhcH/YjgK/YiaL family protein